VNRNALQSEEICNAKHIEIQSEAKEEIQKKEERNATER
jgi:hypothetical protein